MLKKKFYNIQRFPGNPLIYPGMPGLEGHKGDNICGPSVIKVPDWIQNPMGKYYMYFAHHKGAYIRLAYSDSPEGPWNIFSPGVLHVDDTCCYDHIASPDVHVDVDKKEIHMYFHGQYQSDGDYREYSQLSFLAVSHDGIHFKAFEDVLGPFYFRVFRYKDYHYVIAKDKNEGGVLLRSQEASCNFTVGKNFIKRMRHAALYQKHDVLYIFYTRMWDKPERILLSRVDLRKDWLKWEASFPVEIVRPEMAYEGADLPVVRSESGPALKAVHQLRDPAIFEDGGDLYLFYSVAGEQAIAGGRLAKDFIKVPKR